MLDCLIFGDSIAIGVQQEKPKCVIYAKVGINSKNFHKNYMSHDYGSEVSVISLGSNDDIKMKTKEELLNIRNKIKSQRVYWILPNEVNFPDKYRIVKEIAEKNNDFVIKAKEYSKDGVHPTTKEYKSIASQIE